MADLYSTFFISRVCTDKNRDSLGGFMTRIFTDGAEFGDLLFWNSIANLTADTTQKRSGSYSYMGSSAAAAGALIGNKNFTALSEFYLRIAFYVTSISSTSTKVCAWRNSTTELGNIRINLATSLLELYTSTNTLVATGTHPISVDTWYLLEVHVKIADASGVVEARLDGLDEASFTGDTKPGSATTVDNFTINSVSGLDVWFDDLAMNDISNTDGKNDNSWCGDGKIFILYPNDNGTTNQFTGSDADSTNNYLHVDEIPHDTDSTYVEDSVSGHKDMYNLIPFSGSGMTVLRVYPEARIRDTVSESGSIHLGLRTYSTEYKTSSPKPLLTSYTKIVGDDYKTNPYTTSGWTNTEIDALEFLAEIP